MHVGQSHAAPIPVGVEIADAGTRVAVVLGAEPSARHWHLRLPSPPEPDEAVSRIAELAGRALVESGLVASGASSRVATGVALWGAVDAAGEVVRSLPPASAWEGYPLAETLRARLGGPVQLLSATAAAALAEYRAGAGVGSGRLLYVLMGRSVTSAFLARGRLMRGAHGGEGLIAHMRASQEGLRCSCGLTGHLEPIASAQSIVRRMIGRASRSEASTAAMLGASGGRAEAMSAADVIRLATQGEPAAQAVVNAALDALARALADTVALLDPDRIVLAGPAAATGEEFLGPLRERLNALTSAFALGIPDLAPAGLDPVATLVGARLFAADLAAGADEDTASGVF